MPAAAAGQLYNRIIMEMITHLGRFDKQWQAKIYDFKMS
jgi:hypothetical protein